MTRDDPERQLSAALRAQAAGLAAGQLPDTGTDTGTGTGTADGGTEVTDLPPGSALPGWRLLGFAVLLGGLAGALAGTISTW